MRIFFHELDMILFCANYSTRELPKLHIERQKQSIFILLYVPFFRICLIQTACKTCFACRLHTVKITSGEEITFIHGCNLVFKTTEIVVDYTHVLKIQYTNNFIFFWLVKTLGSFGSSRTI